MDVGAKDRLAAFLNEAIERQGLRAFARAIGVSPATVSRWALGDSFPDGNNRAKVSRALGMTLEQFDQIVLQGRQSQRVDPVEDVVALVMSLAPEDVARVQRACADRVMMFSATGASQRPPKDPLPILEAVP